jgi:diacylglycerol O-acyltransferase
MSRHSMVFTNVPGPTAPVVMFGSKVRDMVFGVGNLVSQVSIVSYAGEATLSMVIDPDEVKEAHLVGEFFQEELAELRKKGA